MKPQIATLMIGMLVLTIAGCTDKKRHVVSKHVGGAHYVFPVDLDRDGDMDILSAGYDSGKIFWHENDGKNGFVDHVVIDNQGKATSVYAKDIDHDGRIDNHRR